MQGTTDELCFSSSGIKNMCYALKVEKKTSLLLDEAGQSSLKKLCTFLYFYYVFKMFFWSYCITPAYINIIKDRKKKIKVLECKCGSFRN